MEYEVKNQVSYESKVSFADEVFDVFEKAMNNLARKEEKIRTGKCDATFTHTQEKMPWGKMCTTTVLYIDGEKYRSECVDGYSMSKQMLKLIKQTRARKVLKI